jgi:hypothetical protein
LPASSARARVGGAWGETIGPLSPITRWNSPFASGEVASSDASIAPADWPKSVTLPGSPPNAATLSRTQRSAAIWSRIP